MLTRGHPVSLVAWFTGLDPAAESFTGVVDLPAAPPLVGQVRHLMGDRSARFTFLLLRGDGEDNHGLSRLLDESAAHAGEWGACNLLAEIPEHLTLPVSLRRNGYMVYANQVIWQVPLAPAQGAQQPDLWHPVGSQDELMVRSFYQALVPPLVQSAEAWQADRLSGYIHQQDGEVLGFVEAHAGPQGIFLQPVLHPAVSNPEALLADLLTRLPGRHNRPVFLAVRSYQAGLDDPLEKLGCQPKQRSVLMVKHLALTQRVLGYHERLIVTEKPCPEPTASMMSARVPVDEPLSPGRLN